MKHAQDGARTRLGRASGTGRLAVALVVAVVTCGAIACESSITDSSGDVGELGSSGGSSSSSSSGSSTALTGLDDATAAEASADASTSGGSSDMWHLPLEGLAGALYSVSADGLGGAWAVGADVGQGPMLFHQLAGGTWRVQQSGLSGSLWWITPDTQGTSMWAAGDRGQVVRMDAASGQLLAFMTPTADRLYAVVVGDDGIPWACGGDVLNRTGVLWAMVDGQWNLPLGLDPALLEGFTPFKIWRQAGQAWVVGLGGVALHHDGSVWRRLDVPGRARLVTVHGNGTRVVAVGGNGRAQLFEWSAGQFIESTPEGFAPVLNGVHVSTDGTAVAVGNQGSVWRDSGTGWQRDESPPPRAEDFHAVHIDAWGQLRAVGGFLLADPATGGLLLAKSNAL